MDISAFEDIGLSHIEIKVFITLLELGEAKAGKIIEKTGLQSSSVYNAINSLIERGLVSYVKKTQVKYYKAADPEAILEYLDKKKSDFLKILPELKEKQSKKVPEGVEFFKSFKGIKTMVFELLKDSKKGDTYRFFSVEDPQKYKLAVDRVFRSEKQLRKERKLMTKGLFHESIRNLAKRSSVTQKKYLDFPMPPNTLILGDKVAVISWDETPSGILITSKDIANSYIEFFEHLWKVAKK